MIDTAVIALATFFAAIGPFDVAAIFAALTTSSDGAHRRSMAIRGTLIGGGVLILFALVGEVLLTSFGISLAALRTAGGILLLLIGIDMVFARSTGGTSTTNEEEQEATTKEDISVFPIGMPLVAGPGAMSASVLLMANTDGDIVLKVIVISSLLVILIVTFISMILAGQLQRVLGVTGMHVIARIFGVLLSALAVQFIFDGLLESGILGARVT